MKWWLDLPSPSLSKSKNASLNSAICSSESCVAVADSVMVLKFGLLLGSVLRLSFASSCNLNGG